MCVSMCFSFVHHTHGFLENDICGVNVYSRIRSALLREIAKWKQYQSYFAFEFEQYFHPQVSDSIIFHCRGKI